MKIDHLSIFLQISISDLSFLKRMRHRRVLSRNSFSKKSDALQTVDGSRSSSARSKEVPLSSLDGIDQEMPPTHRRRSTRGSVLPNFTLIVIDTSGGTFAELSTVVAEFRKNMYTGYNRVVWLDRPGSGNFQPQGLTEDKLPASDIIISKPFHGSRLYQVLKLLPEYGRELPTEMSEAYEPASTSQPRPIASPSSSSDLPLQSVEIKEVDKPPSGKKVLLVEDDPLLQRIATAVPSRLGATIEISVNGQEALQAVQKDLQDQATSGTPHSFPYDYIFMDCQMPVMYGIEATRKIGEEVAKYGVHMPIFAVLVPTPMVHRVYESCWGEL